LSAFFEKYSGLGVAAFKANPKQDSGKVVTYDFEPVPEMRVAETPVEYGKKD
jgi:hypothetical protein